MSVEPDFNSRSCEGATAGSSPAAGSMLISTHAPVKERHGGHVRHVEPLGISTHAPVKERPDLVKAHEQMVEISTHAPVKERHHGLGGLAVLDVISTHAPVKERPAASAPSPPL